MWRSSTPRPTPTTITPENEALNQYFGRIAQANQRFTDEGVPGWRTDRGEVFINLGPPDEIDREQPRDDGQPDRPLDLPQPTAWTLFFRDESGFGRLRLLPSSRADSSGPSNRGAQAGVMKPSGAVADVSGAHAARRSPLPPYLPRMPNHTPPQLFLIDGYALIYRAFFAMISRPLRTTKGENTSAAWGVVNFLLRLREKYRPDYVAWINDAGTSFREERYPEYKSTREKLDDALQADFDRAVERICAAARGASAFRSWPSRATRPTTSSAPWPGRGRRRTPGRSSSRATRTSTSSSVPASRCSIPGAAARRRWTRSGSTSPTPPSGWACRRAGGRFPRAGRRRSDNIPGVKGIGEKGAQKLLAEYGRPRDHPGRAGEVTAKRTREALLAQADAARLSQELVTIQRDVPVELTSPTWCCRSRTGRP